MPTAVVWGASGGIGAALVRGLKARHWTVYGAARDESRVPAEADGVVGFDAGSSYSIQQALFSLAQQTDGLDLVIYAAGLMHPAALDKIESAAWEQVMAANFTGAQWTAAGCLPLLNPGAHLMFIGAYVDRITLPRMGAYVAAKSALETWAKVLAKENRKHRVTLVHMPAVDTPFWANVPFNLPAGALTPDQAASAMLDWHDAGQSGTLDIEHG